MRFNLNKRPVEYAREFYPDDFDEQIDDFLSAGRYIYSGDDFFVLAYPYFSECFKDGLLRPDLNKTLDKCDTWVIHYFAGDIGRLFAIAPFDLDYVAFQRRNGKYRLHKTEDLKRRF